jgi:heme/copper-type cytochrome/quinol oxidase subunit 2
MRCIPPPSAAFRAALREYYAYRTSGLQHRRRVFEWQLQSSKVIFATVLVLVASGVVFAAIQFYVGLRRTAGPRPDPEHVTELGLSTAGVKVSSPVLGVIILVISLGFFYLYLVYIYPISEIW